VKKRTYLVCQTWIGKMLLRQILKEMARCRMDELAQIGTNVTVRNTAMKSQFFFLNTG